MITFLELWLLAQRYKIKIGKYNKLYIKSL